jgi:hypothetical protein
MWKWDTYLGGGHTTKKMVAQLAGKVSRLPSEYFGTNAASVYRFDVDALAPLADRIGPMPTDLGQDPDRAVDPAEVAAGRWWKEGLVPPGSV